MKITMKEIKDFYLDQFFEKIKTENTPYSGRIYKIGDDLPLSRQQLEIKYLHDKNRLR
nr:hypothetical protein [Moritella viscosa]SHO15411.1 Putative uncharacterized protein [Moritella viscosa]